MDTKAVGEKTEAVVLAALLQIYPTVLLPFGDNSRYDLVFEDFDRSFNRVQCKTGRYKNGAIEFNAYSTNHVNTVGKGYRGEVEYFGVNCPGFTEVYLVPVDEVGTTKVTLRVEPQKKTGGPTVRWAKDYLLQ